MNKPFIFLVLVAVMMLGAGTSAVAEKIALTDGQLDVVTAGRFPEDWHHIPSAPGYRAFSSARQVVNRDINVQQNANQVDAQNFNENVDALNVATVAEATGNSLTLDNSENRAVVGGAAQFEAKAVTIVNGVGNKVGTGVNAHAVIDRGLGELSRSGHSSSSITGTSPLINQSNIIIHR